MTDMARFDRYVIQAGTAMAIKDEETGNFALVLDVPSGAKVHIENFTQLSEHEAQFDMHLVELIETYDAEDDADPVEFDA